MQISSGEVLKSDFSWKIGSLPQTIPDSASGIEDVASLKVKYSSPIKLTSMTISSQEDQGATIEFAVRLKYSTESDSMLLLDGQTPRIFNIKINGRVDLPDMQGLREIEIVPLTFNGSSSTVIPVHVEFFGCAEIGL